MVTLFLLMPIVALLMVTNIILACYVAIRLGYGPPNWQEALNLIIPLTTLQDHLNEGRDWLEEKAPWTERYISRLHLPRPIIFIDTSVIEEDEGESGEEVLEHDEGMSPIAVEQLWDALNPHTPVSEGQASGIILPQEDDPETSTGISAP